MKYTDLVKGDWFVSAQDDKAVFMKIDEHEAVHLANHVVFEGSPSYCSITPDEDEEVEFCGHFIWDRDNEDSARSEDYFENDSTFTNEFYDIPLGCIYKGKGDTWYRKLSPTTSVVVWSVNVDTMGNIYSRKEKSKGSFYICKYWYFTFPEVDIIF